jgi:hypothetical protein
MKKKFKIFFVALGIIFIILLILFLFIGSMLANKTPPPSNFVEGEVVKVKGSLVNIVTAPEFNGFVSHSNQTTKFGDPTFVFSVKTPKGVYVIQIDPTDTGGSPGPQTIYNLAAVVKEGKKIRFPTEVHGRKNAEPKNQPMGFSKSKIGMLDPDDIEIL